MLIKITIQATEKLNYNNFWSSLYVYEILVVIYIIASTSVKLLVLL